MSLSVKILGSGCANCKSLERSTINALAELNLDAAVTKVKDIQKILTYGVMRTPALVINEKVVLYGRVPNVSELKDIIQKNI